MPQKTFEFTRRAEATDPLSLPSDITPGQALDRVLRLPAVGSKRFLTTKVDRCVTGECIDPSVLQHPWLQRCAVSNAFSNCIAVLP